MRKRFKLQPVLNYRRNLEAEARRCLTESLEHEQAVCRQISEMRDRLRLLCEELADQQGRGIALVDLMLHRARIEGVEALLKKLERDLVHWQKTVIDRRRSLCEASRDKKLLERLKEKVAEEQRQFQNRQETILLDEIALHLGKGET